MPKKRKHRKDMLPNATKFLVQDWFISSAISREVPCKRTVHSSKGDDGSRQIVPVYLMTITLVEAFQLFKAEHPDIKVGFTSFRKLKPKEVRRISDTNRRTCLC